MVLQPAQHFERVLVCIVELFAGSLGGFAQVCSGGSVSFCDCLPGASFGVDEHRLTAFLGLADDGAFIQSASAFQFRLLQRQLGSRTSFLEYLVPPLKHLLRLSDVGGHRQSHLVDDVEHSFAIDHEVATDGQTPRLDNQFFEAIYEFKDFHECRPPGASFRGSTSHGSRS